MSARYYISPVLPPDTITVIDPETGLPEPFDRPQRLAIADAIPKISYSAVIPTLPNGLAAFSFGIAFCKATDWTGIEADARNFRLFQGSEGEPIDLGAVLATCDALQWRDMPAARRTLIRNRLGLEGIPTADISNTTSLRAILQKAGRHLQPGFDETKLFVN